MKILNFMGRTATEIFVIIFMGKWRVGWILIGGLIAQSIIRINSQ